MSFFHQTIAFSDEEEGEEEEERVSFESEVLACYNQRLSSSKEDEDEDEESEEEEADDEKTKAKKVSFHEDVLVCPTYTKAEYDREPDDDWQEKERLVEEAVERLDIVIVDSDPRLLLQLVKFCDYHRMMETDEEEDDVFGKEEDPAPLCDFGVYVEEVSREEEASSLNIMRGDMVLTLEDQDFLSSTASQLKHQLGKVGRPRVSLTLGRPRPRS